MKYRILRIADGVLALFWLWVLVISAAAGRIGGTHGFQSSMAERPGQFWFAVFMLALMVLHFGGLAIVGQGPRKR